MSVGVVLGGKEKLLVVSAQTHTHTHTTFQRRRYDTKRESKKSELWIHSIKNILSENKKCSKQTDELFCIFIISSFEISLFCHNT